MTAAALLDQAKKENKKLTDDDIDAAMRGNICRCCTYPRIRDAVRKLAGSATS